MIVCVTEALKLRVPLFDTAPAPDPKVPAVEPLPTCKVPAVIVVFEVYVFVPDKINADVELFSVTPVTEVPITALISVEPEPEPLLVTVPTLFTLVPESVKA